MLYRRRRLEQDGEKDQLVRELLVPSLERSEKRKTTVGYVREEFKGI